MALSGASRTRWSGMGSARCSLMYDENVAVRHVHVDARLEPTQARPTLRDLRRRDQGRSCTSRATSGSTSGRTRRGSHPRTSAIRSRGSREPPDPRPQMQVDEVHDALVGDLEDAGVTRQAARRGLHRHQHDEDIRARRASTWTDGMTPMMEARAIKSPDEQNALRIVGVDVRRAPLRDVAVPDARVSPRTRSRHTGSSSSTPSRASRTSRT